MKRITIFFLLCFMLLVNVASAQTVTVTGSGNDKDSAVRDAMRTAVETVVGTFIDSKTLIDKNVVALDDIYAKSQGFVRDVRILNESESAGMYNITATIDVDTNPDAQLMSRLTMIMLLNDPRIGVVVLKNNTAEPENDEITETALNERLLELGFSHVVDANMVAKLQDSRLINSIYNGDRGLIGEVKNYGMDYLVLGKSSAHANKIRIPDRNGGYQETLLTTGKAELAVKIIKVDTGDIVGAFSTDGQGVENSDVYANNKALKVAAANAAEKLEEKFRKINQAFSGLQVTVTANDSRKADQLIQELRSLSGVNNVSVREKNGNRTILNVDTVHKPHAILQMLKNKSRLGIFADNMSNSAMTLVIS